MAVSDEDEWEYWNKKAVELTRTQLEGVGSVATRWSALLTALLGIFGAVAFAGGLTTLDKLPPPLDAIVVVMTTIAVVTAAIGTIFFALAAGGLGTRKIRGPLDGMTLRSLRDAQAEKALAYLRIGKSLAAATAVLVILGSLGILWFGRGGDGGVRTPDYIAVFEDTAVCGELAVDANGALKVGDTLISSRLVDLLPVEDCPGSS